jgi:prolyl-tRNA editing enzyme YbaK/EbsC (Cys-tRNA(Pro) deacylase)
MAVPPKVIKFLDSNKIKYEIVNHRTVYTAYDKAATLKVRPNVIGKTLVLKTNKDLVIVLIPGNKNLDKNKFLKVVNKWSNSCGRIRVPECSRKGGARLRYSHADFVSEKLMKNKFRGVKIGAVPPFGSLYKLLTFVDRGLLKEKNVFVNSGIYEASFKLSPKVFEKVGGIFGSFLKSKSK